jgi:hypothetical protein
MTTPLKKQIPYVGLRSKPLVLRSESAEEYISLHARLVHEIAPRGPIEELFVEEMTALIWEIQRLRNCKISTIRQAYPQALLSMLKQLLFNPKPIIDGQS